MSAGGRSRRRIVRAGGTNRRRNVRTGAAWLWLVAVVVGFAADASAAEPKVTAQAALLMDARTGEILWSKNADQKRAPASTTKIVTTMLALESGRLDESFTVSSRAQAQVPSKLYLRKGEKLTLRDLTYALMLKSANDGAVVVAEGLGGSVEAFAKTMEARARKAGATRTTFRNPSGLPHTQHLTTARDLAQIVRAALDVPGFRRVASTQSRQIRVRSSKSKTVSLNNKNRLVRGYFASVIGKTGYTRAAGRCFAGAATYEGREVIVVVLGARDLWGDTRKLLEWAHRGDGKNEWPRTQMASAKSGSKPAPPVAAPAKAPPSAPKTVTAKAPAPATRTAPAPKTVTASVRQRPSTTSRSRAASPAPIARPASVVPPPAPRVRSAALTGAAPRPAAAPATTRSTGAASAPRVRSAALAPPAPPQRVAAVRRPSPPPAYVSGYRPQGNVTRGCTGHGCDPGTRQSSSR